MDATTYSMLLVTKLWGLACCYRDGFQVPNKLSNDQKERMVTYLPTLLEFSSFVFFSSGCVVGPFIEYSNFKNWIEYSGEY